MCGFIGAPVDNFDATKPAVFPTNFPNEQFYMLASSTLTLPNGGKAVLNLGLEAAFLNQVQNGDQITFSRQRVFVTGGPANATLTFHEPFGDLTVDTDDTGRAHFTEDIAPSVGNFTTPLKGNVGPFLTWDTGTVKTPTGEYLGDPAQLHAITGSPLNYNKFGVDWTDGSKVETTDFTLQGKVSTNTGFDSTQAVATTDGKAIDVFASSLAGAGQLYVSADSAAGIPATPMASNGTAGAKSFYARVPVTGALPANVTLNNIGDAPTSTINVAVTKASPITVTDASYDGTTLHVTATSTNAASTLTVQGYSGSAATLAGGVADIPTTAPPANATVSDGSTSASAPVRITGGGMTPAGQPAGAALDRHGSGVHAAGQRCRRRRPVRQRCADRRCHPDGEGRRGGRSGGARHPRRPRRQWLHQRHELRVDVGERPEGHLHQRHHGEADGDAGALRRQRLHLGEHAQGCPDHRGGRAGDRGQRDHQERSGPADDPGEDRRDHHAHAEVHRGQGVPGRRHLDDPG